MLKFALVASLVLNAALLGTAGYRAYRHSGQWVSPLGHVVPADRFLFEELALRPEQVRELKERTIPFRAEVDRRRQEIMEKRKELVALMRAERTDRKAIDATIAEFSRMQEALQRRITAHMLELKSSLDKENQQKFIDLIERRMGGAGHAPCPPGQGG
jgi:Spy/CpxP family protein refolding chaperone